MAAVPFARRNAPREVQHRIAVIADAQEVAPAVVTSGGVLWRIGAGGEPEICLARAAGGWTIPRGRIHEDERIRDAAIRQILTATGFTGRAGRAIGPVRIGVERAHLFLLRCARASQSMFHDGETAGWLDLAL